MRRSTGRWAICSKPTLTGVLVYDDGQALYFERRLAQKEPQAEGLALSGYKEPTRANLLGRLK
ncbi:MAG: hypothetical protein R2748_19635 [Bryobacterales bacterium]